MPGAVGPSKIRDDFWTQLVARLRNAGYHPSQRGNYCYLGLGVANAKIVLTAPTGDGGVQCKLALAGSRRPGTLTPEAVFEQLHKDRDAIGAEVGCGRLQWGSGRSRTRVYLRRGANLGDRRTWEETSDWLISCAGRFAHTFRPRLIIVTSSGVAGDLTRPPGWAAKAEAPDPPNQTRRAPPTLIRQKPDGTWNRSAPVSDHKGDFALEARLEALARRFDLALKRPQSAHGDAWSLEGHPEPSSAHLHRYAYALWWRTKGEPRLDDMVAWVMLNPSTGDTDNNPRPTLGYCRNRTRADWKHGGLLIINLFAYRATDPIVLHRVPREVSVGPSNDHVLLDLAPRCALAVAAWGQHGSLHGRARDVTAMLPDLHGIVNRNGRTAADGSEPSHPRWLPATPWLYRLAHEKSSSK